MQKKQEKKASANFQRKSNMQKQAQNSYKEKAQEKVIKEVGGIFTRCPPTFPTLED